MGSRSTLAMIVPSRRLDWPDCRNTRDLGGLPLAGGTTRTGVLVRSDNLRSLTASGQEAMVAYGVTDVIDLRSESEVASSQGRSPREEPVAASPSASVLAPRPGRRRDHAAPGRGAGHVRPVPDDARPPGGCLSRRLHGIGKDRGSCCLPLLLKQGQDRPGGRYEPGAGEASMSTRSRTTMPRPTPRWRPDTRNGCRRLRPSSAKKCARTCSACRADGRGAGIPRHALGRSRGLPRRRGMAASDISALQLAPLTDQGAEGSPSDRQRKNADSACSAKSSADVTLNDISASNGKRSHPEVPRFSLPGRHTDSPQRSTSVAACDSVPFTKRLRRGEPAAPLRAPSWLS